jgi:hypothetical protein
MLFKMKNLYTFIVLIGILGLIFWLAYRYKLVDRVMMWLGMKENYGCPYCPYSMDPKP